MTLRAPAKWAAETAAMSRGTGVRGSTTTNGKPRARSAVSCSPGSGGKITIAPSVPGRDGSDGSKVACWAAVPASSTTARPCSARVSATEETISPK